MRAIRTVVRRGGLSVLADPVVELHGSDGQLIALNDDWASGSQQGEITQRGFSLACTGIRSDRQHPIGQLHCNCPGG